MVLCCWKCGLWTERMKIVWRKVCEKHGSGGDLERDKTPQALRPRGWWELLPSLTGPYDLETQTTVRHCPVTRHLVSCTCVVGIVIGDSSSRTEHILLHAHYLLSCALTGSPNPGWSLFPTLLWVLQSSSFLLYWLECCLWFMGALSSVQVRWPYRCRLAGSGSATIQGEQRLPELGRGELLVPVDWQQ